MYRLLMACFAMVCVLQFVPVEAGTKCSCDQHKAEAEAAGTCSKTETSSKCSLKFSSTPRIYRQLFVEYLAQFDRIVRERYDRVRISTDVDASLTFAFTTPPGQWSELDIVSHLPLLFAMSQRPSYADGDTRYARPELDFDRYDFAVTERVVTFIVKHANEILQRWSDRNTLYDDTNFESFSFGDDAQAAVSFGCLQLRFDGDVIETMVKTRFSLGGYNCTDTDPDVYQLQSW